MLRPGTKILVIEDNELNLELATTILVGIGYDVISARDAETGIRLAQGAQPGLVLLDIGLPGMDGFAAAKELKRGAQTASIPLIAITAHALFSDEQRARAVGFSGYLAKPIRSKALIDLVGRVLCAS
jgi:CheY-like chemotaxis protein